MFASLIENFFNKFRDTPPQAIEKTKELSPELLKKIRKIQIKTNYLVNDIMAGEYVSAFKGSGMEFSEVREYVPGDDVRLIDWNVTARMDRPFIKGFQEERELTVMLLVDISSSGKFGSAIETKGEISAEIASILAFSAIKNNDKVGLILFSDRIESYIPPKKGRAHIWNVIRAILSYSPKGKKTDLNLPLEFLLQVHKRKTAAFFISDFQATGYEKSMRLARQKHDLAAMIIIDPREQSLPLNSGILHLEDAETGESTLVDTHNKDTIKQFEKIKADEKKLLLNFLKLNGIDSVEIFTNQPLADPIIRYFKFREKKR
jgi:uncharacterized protein (DUF58 family)